MPSKITFTLADLPKVFDFVRDLNDGKIIEGIEKQEIQKLNTLARNIDEHAELLPIVQDIIRNKKTGGEIKEALLQDRALVHALFDNKVHVLGELSRIIDELENQVKMLEYSHKQNYFKVISPQKGYEIQRHNDNMR